MFCMLNEENKNRVRVGRSIAGLGLFAVTSFSRDELVLEYVGPRLPNKDFEGKSNLYIFALNSRFAIDGRARSNTARYINHSCKPNCAAEIRKGKIYIRAQKLILPGEEFTYDYGNEYFQEFIKPHGCRCIKCQPQLHEKLEKVKIPTISVSDLPQPKIIHKKNTQLS